MALHRVRFQWGYRIFYAPYPWQHREYCWDGAASVSRGRIVRSWSIFFKGSYGDNREELIPLTEPRWYWQQDTVQIWQGGVVLEIEGDMDCEVELATATAEMRFTLQRLRKERFIRTHVGPRDSNVDVEAFFDDDDPNLDGPKDLQQLTAVDGRSRSLADAITFRGPVHRCWRIFWAWALPGQSVEVDIPRSLRRKESARDGCSIRECSMTIAATIRWSATTVTPGETPEQIDMRREWNPASDASDAYIDNLPYLIELNGTEIVLPIVASKR